MDKDFAAEESKVWRSILLSAYQKTYYPYCRYIRVVDLYILDHVVRYLDSHGSGREFFDGALQQLCDINHTNGKESLHVGRTIARMLQGQQLLQPALQPRLDNVVLM